MLIREQDDEWGYVRCFSCGDRWDQTVLDHRYLQAQFQGIPSSCDAPDITVSEENGLNGLIGRASGEGHPPIATANLLPTREGSKEV